LLVINFHFSILFLRVSAVPAVKISFIVFCEFLREKIAWGLRKSVLETIPVAFTIKLKIIGIL